MFGRVAARRRGLRPPGRRILPRRADAPWNGGSGVSFAFGIGGILWWRALTSRMRARYFAQSIVPSGRSRRNPLGRMNKRRFTIYDLAGLAHVSASTVSAVLNGNWKERRIAEATAQRCSAWPRPHKYNVQPAGERLCARTGRG
jgi:hypothetical protein